MHLKKYKFAWCIDHTGIYYRVYEQGNNKTIEKVYCGFTREDWDKTLQQLIFKYGGAEQEGA